MTAAPPRPTQPPAGAAFGLDVVAGFEILGLGSGPESGRRVVVEQAGVEEIEGAWRPLAPARLSEHHYEDGRTALTIDADAQAGFLFRAEGFGSHLIAPDGERIRSAPPEVDAWRWQRYLCGQLLPFAAVLQGLEAFHASAVAIDGRAVAIVGGSGAGKSTLAAHLVLGGASFLTDDVVAVEPSGDGVSVHPGPTLANIRHDATELIASRDQLGERIGGDDDTDRVRYRRVGPAGPLAACCFLIPDPAVSGPEVRRLEPLDPRLLHAGTFNFVLRSADRLERLLDTCWRISRSAAALEVRLPTDVQGELAARRVEQQIRAAWSEQE